MPRMGEYECQKDRIDLKHSKYITVSEFLMIIRKEISLVTSVVAKGPQVITLNVAKYREEPSICPAFILELYFWVTKLMC